MEYSVHVRHWEMVSNLVEDINEFTDTVGTARIPMKIITSELGGFQVFPMNKEDNDRFKSAVEYVIEMLWTD